LLAASLLLPAAAPATPVDFPFARMVAQQDAMMQRIMSDMDSLMAMPLPDPEQMVRSVMNGMPQVAPGSGVVVPSITTGNGTCTQTITYGPQANGGQPVVKTSSTGNACGALGSSAPVGVTQPLPAPRRDRLWSIEYPARPVTGAHTAAYLRRTRPCVMAAFGAATHDFAAEAVLIRGWPDQARP
jgi:hypothetical protein